MPITPRQAIVAAATVLAAAIVTTTAVGARGRREFSPPPASAQPPQRLSETGLYLDGTLEIDPRNRPYSPQYPLWSDGAGKSRWVRLPEGSAIDISRVDAWDFPVGTKFWKEFAFKGRRVETRFLWKANDEGWVFASYAWNDDQTDAILASPERGVARAFEIAPGTYHSIPSESECRACHDSARTEILGFSALQLSTDRDPYAPHAEPVQPGMVTLGTLMNDGLLQPARPDLLTNPPRMPGDAVTRAALGYLSANCGHCHNPEGSLASLGFSFKYSSAAKIWQDAPAVKSAMGRESHWQIPGAPDGASRVIAPSVPELSAIARRMRSRSPASQMPPLGTAMADQEGFELIERWIASLK